MDLTQGLTKFTDFLTTLLLPLLAVLLLVVLSLERLSKALLVLRKSVAQLLANQSVKHHVRAKEKLNMRELLEREKIQADAELE